MKSTQRDYGQYIHPINVSWKTGTPYGLCVPSFVLAIDQARVYLPREHSAYLAAVNAAQPKTPSDLNAVKLSSDSNAKALIVYLEYTKSKHHKDQQVWFRPAVTIECAPPYVKGKRDSCWVRKPLAGWPKESDRSKAEQLVGMLLLPL